MIALFDLNGTLTDPAGIGDPWARPDLGLRTLRGAVLSGMAATLAGRPFVPFAAHVRDALAIEVDVAGLDPARIDDAMERVKALDPFPDAAPALDLVSDAGIPIGVLTNSGAAAGEATLVAAGLRDRVAHVFGVDAVERYKPHPDTYGHAVAALGVPPAGVVMVAAHQWDTSGARSAGLRTAWVARGEGVHGTTAAEPEIRGDDLLDVARRLVAAAG